MNGGRKRREEEGVAKPFFFSDGSPCIFFVSPYCFRGGDLREELHFVVYIIATYNCISFKAISIITTPLHHPLVEYAFLRVQQQHRRQEMVPVEALSLSTFPTTICSD